MSINKQTALDSLYMEFSNTSNKTIEEKRAAVSNFLEKSDNILRHLFYKCEVVELKDNIVVFFALSYDINGIATCSYVF